MMINRSVTNLAYLARFTYDGKSGNDVPCYRPSCLFPEQMFDAS
jgi:hypothetical protein